jgi:hypothetical protein
VIVRVKALLAPMAVGVFLCLTTATDHAQSIASVSDVKVTVYDEGGAVIPGCEVVFKNDSQTIVSHTSIDGSVRVMLSGGRYALTTSKAGFLGGNLDVQIGELMVTTLRVVMKVDTTYASSPDVPFVTPPVPTISDLPNSIGTEPSSAFRVPARKSRSWHCLFLWKCSAP